MSTITNINKVFDHRIRLGIMSILMVNEYTNFNMLKELSNLGRIFFDYPHTNQQPTNRPLFYILPHALLVIGLLLSIFINIVKFKQFDIAIILMALFSVVYIGGISLLSSYNQFIFPILPILLIWISYTLNNYVIFKINLFSLKK
ncbi:hypothetical protein APS56_05810 [Pseudalgibacter alginicilyticus]|uniref:Uncharacterized protein n=1 Tax=Pseudalgibacter alginicilyticus TaxID=1736674 RepID=A0A0P0D9R6_9FLAO|nr:hypothetical protein APS56_05810 [Pseudalgibacter alginicilyticus]